jgi:hypothetical protein
MGVVGILAALALMIGGVIYLTSAGNATRISEAKSWITGALTGMLIMFTSYVLLNEVNPDLIGFKPIKLSVVESTDIDNPAVASEYLSLVSPVGSDKTCWLDRGSEAIVLKGEGILNSSGQTPKVLPEIAEAIKKVALEAKAQGITVVFTSGMRTADFKAAGSCENNTPASQRCNCAHSSGRAVDLWASPGNKTLCPFNGAESRKGQKQKYVDIATNCRQNYDKEKILHQLMYKYGFCNKSDESWHYDYMINGKGFYADCVID